MNVAELIKALQAMPQDAEVGCIWDGAIRTGVAHVWVARGGMVALVDHGQVVYDDVDRPESAPRSSDDRYWSTPEASEDDEG